jgi:tRNA-dihydrouridine synthase
MKLWNKQMQPKLILAPIRGITEKLYRNLFTQHFGGFDAALAPFFKIEKQHNIIKKLEKELAAKNNLLPTIPQILSKDPVEFITYANALFEMGHGEVNWNLGCPHRVVVTKNKGSGLLAHPDLIDSFLDKVCSSLQGKLSVKMRLGYESAQEIFKLIPVLNRYPISEITIHARTGKQMYDGITDKESFAQCIPLLKHPLVYNGDIKSVQDFQLLKERFPTINKWMIGRGALRNPFLAQEILGKNTGSLATKTKKIQEFHNQLYEEYAKNLFGTAHLLDKMLGHWEYLSDFFPQGHKLFKKIKRCKDTASYQAQMKMIFPTVL